MFVQYISPISCSFLYNKVSIKKKKRKKEKKRDEKGVLDGLSHVHYLNIFVGFHRLGNVSLFLIPVNPYVAEGWLSMFYRINVSIRIS